MTNLALSFYILVWPMIVAIVLGVLVRAFVSELRAARREGRPLI